MSGRAVLAGVVGTVIWAAAVAAQPLGDGDERERPILLHAWRIDYADELPARLRDNAKFPSGSLTGMTMLYAAVQSGAPAWKASAAARRATKKALYSIGDFASSAR